MKKYYIFLLVFISICTNAQSWQWGKRGGGDQALGDANWSERVRAIKTDSQGNIYAICPVSTPNLNIDGIPKTGYSNGNTYDYALVSFGCDGTYRWSKVIGGQSTDYISGLEIDQDDNIYISGRVAVTSTGSAPVHFDEDFVLEQSASTVNTFKRGMFLVKYNSDGVMQWMSLPQPEDISLAGNGQCQSVGLSADANGNTFLFTKLIPGVYANGAYTVGGIDGSYHMLRYDSSGNFVSGVAIAVEGTSFENRIKFAVNPQSGVVYFAGYIVINSGHAVSFSGQSVTHDFYLTAYDLSGTFLWKKESSLDLSTGYGFHDIFIDSTGDLLLTGATRTGMQFDTHTFLSSTSSTFPFIIKLNPTGNVIWANNAVATATTYASSISEGATTGGFAGTLTWGPHSLSVPSNTGYDVFMTRFNPATGEMIGLETLLDDDGYADYGTAITKDVLGNFYLGGRFEHFLYVNSATPMINDGPQTDFFIAKFGGDNCELGIRENHPNGLKVYPNPVNDILNVPSLKGSTYNVYSILGQLVQMGTVDSSEKINLESLKSGVYLLELNDGSTAKQTVKIVKR